MESSRRFALFRTLTLREVVAALGAVVAMFAGRSGLFAAVMVTALMCGYAVGFVVALTGVVARPRQPLMLVSLAVHALIGLLLLLTPTIDKWISQRRIDEYRRMDAEQPAEAPGAAFPRPEAP